ncbi:M4 family metallopeptidase, partial [Bacteroidia bacterium]|nr:M4 family metallopeptidase [Bacteroidia bacterium]
LQRNTAKTSSALKYRLKYDPINGLPIYLAIHKKEKEGGFAVNTADESLSLNNVLSDLPSLFGWNEKSVLKEFSRSTDDIGYTHIKYQQYVKNVAVKGGEWIMHLKDGEVQSASGRIYASYDVKTENAIGKEIAKNKAFEHVINNVHAYVAPKLSVIDRTTHTHQYIDFEVGNSLAAKLVYVVEVRPTDLHHYNVWVDAHTAEILKTTDELCEIDGPKQASATDLNNKSVTLNTYQVGSTYYMIDASKSMWTSSQPSSFPDNPVGAIWTIDAGNTAAQSFSHVASSNNSWSEKSSVSAHYNAGIAFDYFKNTYNRNSLNGNGGSIISVVNVSDDDGSSLANAYWNGQAMFYGNGGSAFTPLAGALDVAGHELTHGVVSNTANLEYQGQSGAINESMADVFGAMIDRDDWKMGEDIVKAGQFPGGALRNLQDPHNGATQLGQNGYQPERMGEFYTGTQDNGGVHINSGIVNRAFYLAATGSSMNKEKAEKIWYRALVSHLTSKSQFLDLRYACVDAATALYGANEIAAIKAAFDGVEIYDPNGNSGGGGSAGDGSGDDIPTNTGNEFIVSVDVNIADSNTMYKSTTAPNDYEALTQNTPKRKCSITDDGKYMYYVTNSNLLKRVELNSPFTESTVSNFDWDNVAVSKDGKLLAGVSTDADGAIWVMEIAEGQWNKFTLYNPTYSEGVSAGNVNYADAIEFDNTGQYILYDAQNEITNSSGSNISWWDLGVIRVWDNQTDQFGDGKVEKVFSQLPDNISIGNASYSKNSPHIIAFDYIDGVNNNYSVKATNTITNSTGTIFTQDKLGFPNFSNKDDKLIFDAEDGNGDEVIGVMDLATDKINKKSGATGQILIPDAKWGVWYADGSRNLLSDKKEILSFAFPSLHGSPEGAINGQEITVDVPGGTNLISLTPTFKHSTEAQVAVGSVEQISGVTPNSYSTDVIYKVTAQDESSVNYRVKVNVIAGVTDLARKILLYPNPTSYKLTLLTDINIESVKCFDTKGVEMKIQKTGSQIDLSALARGVYLIEVYSTVGKIIKRINKL